MNPASGIFPSRFQGSLAPPAVPAAPAPTTPSASPAPTPVGAPVSPPPPAAPVVSAPLTPAAPAPPAPVAAASAVAPTGVPPIAPRPSGGRAPGTRHPRSLEDVDRALIRLEDEWRRASVVLGELPTRMERIEAAIGQLGARLDDTMRRLGTLESLNVGRELQTLRADVTELSRLQGSLLTAPPMAGMPAGVGPVFPAAAQPLFPASPPSRSFPSRKFWMIGGIVITGIVLLTLSVTFGPSLVDRAGLTGEGDVAVASSAKRLPSEDKGPSAAGEVLSGDSGDTEVIDDIKQGEEGPRGEVVSQPSAHTEVSSASEPAKSAASSPSAVPKPSTVVAPPAGASAPPAVKPTTTVVASSATAPASGGSEVYVASSYPARAPKAHRTFKVKGPNLTVEVGEEILGGWSDGSMNIDFGQIATAGGSSFTLQNVASGHYHWNVETLSGWRLETEGNQFRLNAPMKINGQEVPVGTGKPHDHGDGANFCVTVLP